ncbi:MFS transporter [Salinicola endophyticus]|uniref:MFS transporter n=1 Tax=Salinicola endophyticus TaxID=1949083 RepID=A0ABY8FFQ6_9GAMM|nr:MFS transporter [Salinicola endophyticus]WFF41638.1 MFS transporter [Salinicola endophyticus]
MSARLLQTQIPSDANLFGIFRAFGFILTGVLAFGLATGGLFPLIGLKLQDQGASDLIIGLITSVFFAGTFAGSLLTERIIARIRHIRTFSFLAATAGISTMALALSDDPKVWILMRFITGFCLGGYYVVIESWINYASTNQTRARGMSIYEAVRMLGIAISPFVLGLGLNGQPYILAGLLFTLAIIPLVFCPLEEPVQNEPGTLPFGRLLSLVPLGMLAAFVSGSVNAAFYGMAGVYGDRAGLDTSEIAIFIGSMLIAPTFAHPIMGAAADRFGRLPVLFVASASSALAAVVIATMASGFWDLVIFSFLLGGFSHPVYSLGVAYVNDRLDPGDFVRAGGALLIAFCLGTTFGPTAAAATMALTGDSGLYLFIAGILTLVALSVAMSAGASRPVKQ